MWWAVGSIWSEHLKKEIPKSRARTRVRQVRHPGGKI